MKFSAALCCLLLALPWDFASGQVLPLPVSIEVRFGAGLPTGNFASQEPGVEAELGPHLGAGAAIHLTRWLAAVGGYSRTRFGCSRCAAQGLDEILVDAGANAALQLMLPGRDGPSKLWVRLGGVYHQISFASGQEKLSSEPAAGLQAGVGMSFAALGRIGVEPALHFRTHSAELDLGGLPGQTLDVSQFLLDVGFNYRF